MNQQPRSDQQAIASRLAKLHLHVASCSDARVMWDQLTSRSKGYGFASFKSREAAERAIQTFHGQFIGTRRVRCGWAQHKQVITAAVSLQHPRSGSCS
jgi:RNA recognition motif-containing protein